MCRICRYAKVTRSKLSHLKNYFQNSHIKFVPSSKFCQSFGGHSLPYTRRHDVRPFCRRRRPVRAAFRLDVTSAASVSIVVFEYCNIPTVATKARLSSERFGDEDRDTFRLSSHITRLLQFFLATCNKRNIFEIIC